MSVHQENRFRAQSAARFRQVGILSAQLEALSREQRQPTQQATTPGKASRRQVRDWMRRNAKDYEGATALAEATNIVFPLPSDAMDDPDHWIWEEACRAQVGK